MSSEKYPEHERIMKVQTESQAIGEFLEWLQFGHAHECGEPIVLAYYKPSTALDDPLVPWPYTIEKLLAQYFDIDLEKIQAEKDQMLAEMKAAIASEDHQQRRGG